MYKYVIFDLDGTILNTIDDLADAGNWVCQNHGWPTHSVAEYKRFVGNGMARLAQRFAPEDWRTPEKIQEILDEFMPYYGAHKADKTAPYAGMPGALARLKGAGVSVAVLTNKADQLAGPVVEGYYPGVFPIVQGALEGVPTKPDPTLLRKLMERMGATAENTLFVGDSNVDIQTAKNGGLRSCGVLWGFRGREELEREGADFIVETPGELADLVLSKPILETERLRLREMTDGDFPALCRMLQDSEVMYAYEHAFSDGEAWDWLRRQQERYRKDGFGLWAVVEKATGQMVGQCGLTMQDLGDGRMEPEVGYLLEKAAWHKGYATEAARGCLDYGFRKLKLPKICATIRDNNLDSQAVARRLGMEPTGRMTKFYYGMDMPHLIFWARSPEGKES